MITHGILAAHGTFTNLIHEIDKIETDDVKRNARKINWEETIPYDNSNRGRYQNIVIYRERWR